MCEDQHVVLEGVPLPTGRASPREEERQKSPALIQGELSLDLPSASFPQCVLETLKHCCVHHIKWMFPPPTGQTVWHLVCILCPILEDTSYALYSGVDSAYLHLHDIEIWSKSQYGLVYYPNPRKHNIWFRQTLFSNSKNCRNVLAHKWYSTDLTKHICLGQIFFQITPVSNRAALCSIKTDGTGMRAEKILGGKSIPVAFNHFDKT